MVYLLSALAAIAASETVLRLSLRNTANATLTAARKSLAVIRSPRISEHWKERVLLRYSQELLLGSLKIALSVAVVVAIVCFFSSLGYLLERDVFGFLMTWSGFGLVSLVSIGYVLLRRRLA